MKWKKPCCEIVFKMLSLNNWFCGEMHNLSSDFLSTKYQKHCFYDSLMLLTHTHTYIFIYTFPFIDIDKYVNSCIYSYLFIYYYILTHEKYLYMFFYNNIILFYVK